ncbi:hypothetical protein [Raineyella sp. LH-20]|uniref:hypothetical protein n=1 Tax=Raineyella sp. LH-20 TaxID=3081204 RepID=UPI002954B378|nr:hypothetical protein [Raineyella sp. LH-20]WOP18165.1 hypothetical protein R0146_13155 [Raineyella sp. LH-20]
MTAVPGPIDPGTTTLQRTRSRTRWFGIWFPVTVFLLFRLYAAVAISYLSGRQVAMPASTRDTFMYGPLPAHPGYWSVITNWDGQWYRYIASDGYGGVSPSGNSPYEIYHTWAFPPGFPLITRLVMQTGLSFPVAATVVNVICGAAAMILLFRLLADRKGSFYAGAGIVLFNSFLTAPLLQAAYSEAMGLLLLVTAFLFLSKRRYLWATVAIVALSLVRIITPPFGLVALVHLIARWRHRTEDPFGWGERISLTVLGLVSVAGAMTWSLTSGLISSVPTGGSSRVEDTSIGAWFIGTYKIFGWWFPALIVVALVAAVVISMLPMMRGWGLDIRTWFWGYPLFLALVTGPNFGLLRYLLLCFPLLFPVIGFLGWGKRFVVVKVSVVVLLGLVLQWWWIGHLLVIYPGSMMP